MAGVAATNQIQSALAGTFLYSINKFPIIVLGLINYLKAPRYFLITKRLTVFVRPRAIACRPNKRFLKVCACPVKSSVGGPLRGIKQGEWVCLPRLPNEMQSLFHRG
jgi:hypothetical protein